MTFKHYFMIILLVVAVTIVSCKKESFLSGKDQITYTEFDPAPALTSVDSFTPVFPSDRQPYPQDSAASYVLDIDNDASADFEITVKHWYDFVSASSPSANYNYEMRISGINSTSEIATLSEGSEYVRIYAEDESVDRTAKWNEKALLTHIGGTGDKYYSGITDTQYIGLRIKKGSRQHYCWLKANRNADTHTLSILSVGYNRANGNNIDAGQK